MSAEAFQNRFNSRVTKSTVLNSFWKKKSTDWFGCFKQASKQTLILQALFSFPTSKWSSSRIYSLMLCL